MKIFEGKLSVSCISSLFDGDNWYKIKVRVINRASGKSYTHTYRSRMPYVNLCEVEKELLGKVEHLI